MFFWLRHKGHTKFKKLCTHYWRLGLLAVILQKKQTKQKYTARVVVVVVVAAGSNLAITIRGYFQRYALVMQRYIVQTIYRVDIGHSVSYRYRQEKYRNFNISLSFRYRRNDAYNMLSYSLYIHPTERRLQPFSLSMSPRLAT